MNKNKTGWLRFNYHDKPREGFAIGPDTRPNTNNIVCLTSEGVRMYTVDKMKDVVDETTLYA